MVYILHYISALFSLYLKISVFFNDGKIYPGEAPDSQCYKDTCCYFNHFEAIMIIKTDQNYYVM